jgi:hypothetical protein
VGGSSPGIQHPRSSKICQQLSITYQALFRNSGVLREKKMLTKKWF